MSNYRSNYSEQSTPNLRWLSKHQIETLHSASIEVLERTGTRVDHPEALKLLKDAGCMVKDKVARIPGWLVEECLRLAPKKIVMGNRKGERVISLEKNRTYFGTGSDLPFTIDLETRKRRTSVKEDIIKASRVLDYLPNFDFVMSNAIATDVPPELNEVHQFEAMLVNTVKPLVFTSYNEKNTYKIIEMAALAVGGVDNLRKSPLMALYSEPISPLVHTYAGISKMFACLEYGVPVIYTPGVVAGGTTPVTKAGTIVQMNAESLAGLVIAQLKYKGSNIIIGGGATPMDMMTTSTLYGSPDAQMNYCAMTELSQYYEVPNFTEAGCSNAPVPDAQAGMEASIGILMSQLSGANLVHDVGYLDGGKTGSLAFLVMCEDFISAARHIGAGTQVNEKTMALDVIDKVGPGGQYISNPHTAKNFRGEIWMSGTFNTCMWDQWEAKGSKTLYELTEDKAKEILANHKPEPLKDSVLEEINKILQG